MNTTQKPSGDDDAFWERLERYDPQSTIEEVKRRRIEEEAALETLLAEEASCLGDPTTKEKKNAQLIAAAPDLLEALGALLHGIHTNNQSEVRRGRDLGRAVIAKIR